ncbi:MULTISPECIES: hypothetical protein [Microbacterium]|uniref:ATP synthase protein I n=1 Tax=Microbacterium testaceum (strain StLB037) TaxID=979556 RepID=A0A1H0L2W7_MICTS|nr:MULTISPECIES: hypothetical protein [Microbacterium]KQM40283.1 hypothetical protein ASE56_08015 [Microbacterium sp. Leaf203]MCY1716718.1 hypothetical protein [Microbacterium sp. SL62]SDO62392.1 hypothetical protein SAMN04487788_0324 [Microbacterium testaceum StLB037]
MSSASPAPRRPLSSTPVLRTALVWGGIVTAVLLVLGAVIGFLVGGGGGLGSALSGVAVSAIFLAVTAISILVANRWFGDPLYVPIFFGIVLGGWLLKLILFIVAIVVLRGQGWVDPVVFYVALVVSVIASLAVDVVVLLRMRIPSVSDVTLPTDPEAGDRRS